MKNEILELEKSFFKYEYIKDKSWLDKTIHNNFKECGKSGFIFNKEETIKSLLSCKEDRKINICNYEFEKINNNTYLVHYITKDIDVIYRTSIWVMEGNLKILFHQASKLNEKS